MKPSCQWEGVCSHVQPSAAPPFLSLSAEQGGRRYFHNSRFLHFRTQTNSLPGMCPSNLCLNKQGSLWPHSFIYCLPPLSRMQALLARNYGIRYSFWYLEQHLSRHTWSINIWWINWRRGWGVGERVGGRMHVFQNPPLLQEEQL